MTRVLCDHCLRLIRDPRKSFIFSAEKFGVSTTDTKVEKVELANNDKLHRIEKVYCSDCMMTLWKHITEFAENSVTNMENK